jgi:PIN domain nuclease of toxin-antitoxin system
VRLLLDTQVLLAVLRQQVPALPELYRAVLQADRASFVVSAASLWEIAIKWRLGKLRLNFPPERLPQILAAAGITLVPVAPEHAVHVLDPLPATMDPFDRMLLAQAGLENLQLMTLDRDLLRHPLAWRPRPA